MPYEFQYYPAFKWTPAGEQVLVNDATEDHPSYLEHHPDDPTKLIEPQTKALFTVEEIKGLLEAGHIAFNPDASADDLRDLLTNGLQTAAIAAGLGVPTGATAEEIYAIMLANSK